MRLDDVLKKRTDDVEPLGNANIPEATSTATSTVPPEVPPPSSPEVTPDAVAAANLLEASDPPHSGAVSPLEAGSKAGSPSPQASPLNSDGLPWHFTDASRTSRPLWSQLPSLNRTFVGIGGACLVLALGRSLVPPIVGGVVGGVQHAVFPYTAAGKQELCASHLSALSGALLDYAKDNDGRFPPLEYQTAQGQRVTWFSLVAAKAEGGVDSFRCPISPRTAGQESLVSSYVMNPALATARASDTDSASDTLLLAEGGSKHDVSLLPPFPAWPSFTARRPAGGMDAAECNFDFRHGGQAEVAYADGHLGTLSSGDWATESSVWGGSAILRRSRDRIAGRSPEAGEFVRRLKAGDVSGAAAYIGSHRAVLKPVSQDLLNLWQLNTGEHNSHGVEELAWNLERAWKLAGDGSFEARMNEQQTQRCQAAMQEVQQGAWGLRVVAGQPSMRGQAPSAWNAEPQTEGRYRRVSVRSPLSSVFVLLEVGQRTTAIAPQPIDWGGSEKDLLRRYGTGGYKRLQMTNHPLSGHTASLWEYEVEKPGGPRLRKRYIGYTDGSTSYVVGCTAPTKDWALWEPSFQKLIDSVETGYFSGE